jgi:hypothetical protein
MTMAGSKRRKMKGGFLDSITSSLTDAWNKTKTAASGAYNSATGSSSGSSTNTTYTSTTPTSTTTSIGGRKRRRTRRMRGGFSGNTGLAAYAAPISGIPSAQPHNWVGGKRTRRRRRCKSRRRR